MLACPPWRDQTYSNPKDSTESRGRRYPTSISSSSNLSSCWHFHGNGLSLFTILKLWDFAHHFSPHFVPRWRFYLAPFISKQLKKDRHLAVIKVNKKWISCVICIKSKRNGRSHIGWIASIITMLSLTSVATLYLAFIPPELLYGKDESRKGLSLAFSVLSIRAAGNVTLGICQRKVSARCFLLLRRHEGAVFRLPHSYPYSVIVC